MTNHRDEAEAKIRIDTKAAQIHAILALVDGLNDLRLDLGIYIDRLTTVLGKR